MVDLLARNWGWIALRGIAAVAFGLLALLYPTLTLVALVLLFGFFVIIDGLLIIASAVINRRRRPHWVALLVSGVLVVIIGILVFALPEVTALVLLYLIAAWAVITGVSEIVVAVRLRKVIEGEWLLIFAGALAVIFGVVLFLFPGAGALAMVLWIGIFMLVIGALLIAFAFRLRRWNQSRDAGGAA